MKPKNEDRKKFTVGVAGLGFMGDHHTRISSTIPGVALSGIFDLDQARSEAVSIKYNTKSFPDFESLLNESDAVIIASPTSTHFDLAVKALDAGKHIFIEKPLASTSVEGEAIIAKAKDNDLVVVCGHIERFNPAYRFAANLIKKDKALIINIKRESPLPERITDANVIIDMMIHDLDLAIKIAGAKPLDLKAKGKKIKTKMLDQAFANIFFSNGIIANIEASRVAEKKERSIFVTCEHSNVYADLLNRTVKQKFLPDPNSQTIDQPKEIDHPVESADQITLELKDFFAAVKRGRDPQVPGEEALMALKLAESIESKILKK